MAVVVQEDTPVGTLIETVRMADPLIVGAQLFDIYRGEQIAAGCKSVALNFTLLSRDHTLTDEEINAAVGHVLTVLQLRYGAKLR